jgi:predicted nucleotidyltransferase
MTKKPWRRLEYKEVVYDTEHWALLERLRAKALRIMEALEALHVQAIVHGSIARGDVTQKSDIDVFVPYQVSSFIVETALEKAGIPVNRRLVVQATPTYAMKAYMEIGENISVSFPLMKMRKVEREFYEFSGELALKGLRNSLRIIGVDKRLMLIEPTKHGHRESTVVGLEEHVAKRLAISVETVLDRVRALLRRDEVGRTGVFIEKDLSADETFEIALKRFADQNPAVRRRLTSLS